MSIVRRPGFQSTLSEVRVLRSKLPDSIVFTVEERRALQKADEDAERVRADARAKERRVDGGPDSFDTDGGADGIDASGGGD